MCPNLNISSVMVNMLNDWLERPIVMRGPGQTLMTSPRHEPHLSLVSPRPELSPGPSVTRLISQHRDMLKHKLRKSRKNILSLLDYVQEQEEDAKIPEYSEIKKPGRKEKRKKGKSRIWFVFITRCLAHHHHDNPFCPSITGWIHRSSIM